MLTLFIAAVISQSVVRDIPEDSQLFGPVIVDWLVPSSSSTAHALWPAPNLNLGGVRVPRTRVPDDVLNDAYLWICRVLREEWRASDLLDKLIPFDDFRLNDILADRYRINGWTLQIVELPSQVAVTVLPPENMRLQTPLTTESGQLYLTQMLQVTSFPAERRQEIEWHSSLNVRSSNCVVLTGGGLAGTVGVASDYWQWWQEVLVWTDGSVASFVFHKRMGSRPDVLGAGPTDPRIAGQRFRDSE